LEGPNDYVEDLRSRLETAYEFARCELKKSALRQKNYYDSKVTLYTYTKGEKVWLYQPHRKIGLSPKLQRLWHGPYVILDILGRNLFRVKKIGSTIQKVVHSDNMKPYGMKVSLNEETKQSLDDKSLESHDEYDSDESTVSSIPYQDTGNNLWEKEELEVNDHANHSVDAGLAPVADGLPIGHGSSEYEAEILGNNEAGLAPVADGLPIGHGSSEYEAEILGNNEAGLAPVADGLPIGHGSLEYEAEILGDNNAGLAPVENLHHMVLRKRPQKLRRSQRLVNKYFGKKNPN
jgi:hypothetical protein